MTVWISGLAMQLGHYLEFLHLLLEQIFKRVSVKLLSSWTEDYSCLKAPFSPDISSHILLSTWQRHQWVN